MRVRPGHITAILVSAFAVATLGTLTCPLLETPAPASAALPAVRYQSPVTLTAELHQIAVVKAHAMEDAVAAQNARQAALERRARHRRREARLAAQQAAHSQPAPSQTSPVAAPASSGDYSEAGLETLWEDNGGSAAEASLAACEAWYESTGDPNADNGVDIGLWQIDPANEPGADLFNPDVNAAEAVRLSDDGTDWADWSPHPECGT